MTPEQQKWLDQKFQLLEMNNAYNRELLHVLTDAILTKTDEDGDTNDDAVWAARDKARLEMQIAMETYGKDGLSCLEIRKRIEAEAKKKN